MTLIPLASFLAGSLLTMLLPILVLIALAIALTHVVKRVPGGDASQARRATSAEHDPVHTGPPGAVEGSGPKSPSVTDPPQPHI